MFFEILGVGPRGDTEEGGQYVFRFGFLGELIWHCPIVLGVGLSPKGRGGWYKDNH
jgi:hypothetical protein